MSSGLNHPKYSRNSRFGLVNNLGYSVVTLVLVVTKGGISRNSIGQGDLRITRRISKQAQLCKETWQSCEEG